MTDIKVNVQCSLDLGTIWKEWLLSYKYSSDWAHVVGSCSDELVSYSWPIVKETEVCSLAEDTVCPMHFLFTLVQKEMLSSQLFFDYILEYTISKVQENEELNGTH
jgi:hypothetical protein